MEEGSQLREHMNAIAADAGVSVTWEGPEEERAKAPPAMMWNTRECHMLLAFALDEAGPEVQTRLKLALFRAHFNERRSLADRNVLLDLAAEAGLHREAAKAALDDEELERRVLAEERRAHDLNITGVPAMILEGKFMIPGAQAPETYVNALRKVAEKVRA
jgi:predicted DsbA family dithiol-disulfide isomerase